MYNIKYTRTRVKTCIRQMAKRMQNEQLYNDDTIFLVMLSGGVWFASHLFDALGEVPNQVHFIKGHSYSDHNRGTFVWDLQCSADLTGRDVIVIDDICDSGETLKAIYQQLSSQVRSITAITLLKRLPCPLKISMPVFSCIEDDTKDFFVGCGLDDNEKGRMLNYIGTC